MSWNQRQNQSIGHLAPHSRARLQTLVAVALFVLGQFAPLAHISWGDHAPFEHSGAAITAECLVCDSAATRTTEAPLANADDSLVALPGAWMLVEMPEGRGAVEMYLGPNSARGPPFHV